MKKWFSKDPTGLGDPVPEDRGLPEPSTIPKMHKVKKPKKSGKPDTTSAVPQTPKDLATANGEPYINIIKVDVDPNNINSGSFEMDWNDKFVLNLIKAGYKLKPTDNESDIVDRWFQTVCRNIALEIYEQDQADPDNRHRADIRVVQSKDLGNGRSEVS